MQKIILPVLLGIHLWGSTVLSAPDAQTQALDLYTQSGKSMDAQDLNKGWELINESLRLNPNYGPAYSRRCNLLIKVGDYQKALPDCNQAIKLDPNYAPAHYNKGRILQKTDQLRAAVQSYSASLRLDPNYLKGWAYLERGDIRLDLKDYRGGVADLTQAIASGDDVCKLCAYIKRGWGWRQLKEYALSESDYNAAIRLDPTHPDSFEGRGYSRESQGNRAGAKQDYIQAAALFKAQGQSTQYLRVQSRLNKL